MLLSLLIFPAMAMLWMLLLDRFGLVQDQPPQVDDFAPRSALAEAPALRPPIRRPA